MTEASSDIALEVSATDRRVIDDAFASAYTAATKLVDEIMADLPRIHPHASAQQNFLARRALLDSILSTTRLIGTPEFRESNIPGFVEMLPAFDIRVDWPIVLLAWYADWTHNASVYPKEWKIEYALDALKHHVTLGREVPLSLPNAPFSRNLGIALNAELRDIHKLRGPWQLSARILKGDSPVAPGMTIAAKVPHCDIPFTCTFMRSIINVDGVWELEDDYNTRLKAEATALDIMAAKMVEDAVQASLPIRARAAAIRAKMTKSWV